MGVAVGEPPTGAAAAEGGGGGGERKGRFAWWCRNWRRRGSSYYQSDAEANVEHFFIAFDSHGRVSFFERIMVELGDGGYIKKNEVVVWGSKEVVADRHSREKVEEEVFHSAFS
jgi:hypothetical protein